MVRLTYCLGNLMAKCDEARPYFGPEIDADSGEKNMNTLLDLLHSYKKKVEIKSSNVIYVSGWEKIKETEITKIKFTW